MNSLKDKYEIKPDDYYDGVRKEILPLVPKHSSRVLEIGCSQGNTLLYLKDNGYCDWTCGVDLFADAVELAKPKLDEVYQANIEETILPIEAESIDLILCLDVLEHLVDPHKVVAYLHKLLVPGGIIIASIPNVRHYSVSFPLIFQNKWEYKSNGVLDNTHLRFFVKDTAIGLMQSSGLKMNRLIHQTKSRDNSLNNLTLGILNSFLTLQYLIEVQKID
jgi:2-polyprenyl-3-methyl-5-hydroxy-6-metoxy-1,4-benzoquinol methylase